MNIMDIFTGELLGTMVLIILGNGVVANVTFSKTYGSKSGLIVIAFGWAIAVFSGVMVANYWGTGGHLNPAVTIGQYVGGKIGSDEAFTYFGAELLGAILGQIVVDIFYWQHIKEEKMATVLGMHSTAPTHKKAVYNNLFSEFVGTSILVIAAYFGIQAGWFAGAPLAVALVVLVIGLSLGGTTGYAINPVRDLMPRVVHFVMYSMMKKQLGLTNGEKVESNWTYSWIPVVAPLAAGSIVGLFVFRV
ncbi:MAG: aquaporin family protein [Mycoplasma sp.]|nr:aquaporin family protein [Mycoplasma sp.]